MAIRADGGNAPVYLVDGSWMTSSFTLRYEVIPDEDDRRGRLGLGAVTDIDILSAVHALPSEDIGPLVPGSGSGVDDVVNSGLVTAVRDMDGSVWARRIASIVLRPLEVVLQARTLRVGLRTADRLAGYAPRTVLVTSDRACDETLLSEASFYGVGVRIGASVTRSDVVLAPAPAPLTRVSAEWWQFTESMYARHLAGVSDPRGHLRVLSQL